MYLHSNCWRLCPACHTSRDIGVQSLSCVAWVPCSRVHSRPVFSWSQLRQCRRGGRRTKENLMKKALMAAAALVALPVMAQAQSPSPGVYIGAEGGINWLLNFNASP